MLQYPGVIPVDGIVFHPGMFGYGRLVREAIDACIVTFLQTCFKATCSLADVHLSTGAWHFVDICLLLPEEGVIDPSEERTEDGSRLEHRSDVEVSTHPPDLLTNASYVREVRWTVVASSPPFSHLAPPGAWLQRQNG